MFATSTYPQGWWSSAADRIRPRRFVAHARRTARAFVLDGRPVLGISAFAVLDDVGSSSLSGILLRMSTYRVVHVVDAARLIEAGFGVLPTFERPHVTITLSAPPDAGALVTLFGEGEPNPRYGELVHRARRRPQ